MVYTSFQTVGDNFDPSKFAFRRISRIYPIYIIYALIYLYFYYSIDAGKSLSTAQFFGSLLLLPGYSSLIIGPGWTLSYEVYFYLCFGIAMMLGLTRGLLALTVFFIAAIMVRFAFDTSNPVVHVFTGSLLIEFLFGAWIGYAVISKVSVGNSVANLMLLLAAAVFGAGIAFGYTLLPSALTWGVPSALLVAGLVFRESNGSVPSLIKKLSFLGDSSYSLYLLHVALIDAVILLAISAYKPTTQYAALIGPFGMMAICVAITAYCIAVALVSYEFVERKLLVQLQSLHKRKIAVVRDKQKVG